MTDPTHPTSSTPPPRRDGKAGDPSAASPSEEADGAPPAAELTPPADSAEVAGSGEPHEPTDKAGDHASRSGSDSDAQLPSEHDGAGAPPPAPPSDASAASDGDGEEERSESDGSAWRRPYRFNPLLDLTTRRPVGVMVLVVAACVFGAVALQQLPLELLPSVNHPRLTIRTEYPTANPEEVESQVSRQVEQGIGAVTNLVRKSSLSRAEMSEVTLDFQWGTDLSQVSTEVRQNLDRVNLPSGAQAPLVLRYDPALEPIVRLALSEEAGLASSPLAEDPLSRRLELRRIAVDVLQPELEKLPGVAAVNVLGGAEPQVRILVSERRLREYGLTIDEISNLLAAQNVEQAAGVVEEGQREFLVRTLNRFRSLAEIRELPVRPGVPLRDVATVVLTERDPEVLTRLDGRASVEIEILKEADANIVTVAHEVYQRLYGDAPVNGQPQWQALRQERGLGAYLRDADNPALEERVPAYLDEEAERSRGRIAADLSPDDALAELLPVGVSVDVLTDQSFFIEDAIRELVLTALIGGLLAILILFVFLRRFVTTVVVALAIPVSIMVTFVPMRLFDVSLNLMSFGGLALGLGMLVDNAIVVLESIARCREEGDEARTAAVRGVSEVFGAIVAATLTTIVVFAPIVFVEGVAGQIFGDQALTIVFALVCSLFVATFVIPVLAALHFRMPSEPSIRKAIFVPRFARRWRRFAWQLTSHAWLAPMWRWLGRPLPQMPEPLREEAESAGGDGQPFATAATTVAPQRAPLHPLLRGLHRAAYLALTPVVVPLALVLALLGTLLHVVELVLATLFESLWRYGFVVLAIVLLVAAWSAAKGTLLAGKAVLAGPARAFDVAFNALLAGYRRFLRAALQHSATVVGIALLLAVFAAYLFASLEQEMLPRLRQGEFTMQIALNEGRTLDQTQRALAEIERVISRYHRPLATEEQTPAVAREPLVDRYTLVAGEGRDPGGERIRRENLARLTVVMRRGAPQAAEQELREAIRGAIAAHPDLRDPEFTVPTLFTLTTPIEVEIRGGNTAADLQRIREGAYQVEQIVRGLAHPHEQGAQLFDEVRTNVRRGNPEIRLSFDRDKLGQHELTPQQAASQLQQKIRGTVPTDYTYGDQRIDVLVELDQLDKPNIEAILGLRLTEALTVGEATRFTYVEGPSEIRRRGNQRTAIVAASPASGVSLSEAEALVERALAANAERLVDGVHVRLSGETTERERSFRSLMFALALSVFLVFVVLAVQFESLTQPFIILMTIPLALVGVILALALLGLAVSVVAVIGVIVLTGIVVNNAIVLIDRINYNRSLGHPLDEAIVEGGAIRLRPILITTLTTVLALLPLTGWLNPLLSGLGILDLFGEGVEIRAPMAIAIVIGLSASALLTLVVIPVVYRIFARRLEG